jgi:hypothetical protein
VSYVCEFVYFGVVAIVCIRFRCCFGSVVSVCM